MRHACLDAAAWKLPSVEEPQGASFTKAVGVLLPYLLSHRSRIASFRQIQPDEEPPGRHGSLNDLPEVCREHVSNKESSKSWTDGRCRGLSSLDRGAWSELLIPWQAFEKDPMLNTLLKAVRHLCNLCMRCKGRLFAHPGSDRNCLCLAGSAGGKRAGRAWEPAQGPRL